MPLKQITSINLGAYTDTNVLVGKDNGIKAKEKSRIKRLIREYYNIQIIIPKNIMSVNPSFLENFIYDVVLHLGEEEFRKRVFFKCEGLYDIESDLNEVISRIKRTI